MVEQNLNRTNLQVFGFFKNHNLSKVEQNLNRTNLQMFLGSSKIIIVHGSTEP